MANFSKTRSLLTVNNTIFILSMFIISMGIMAMAECEEFGLSSREIYRRILAVGNHISYGALEPDTTPCSQPGASYYNCRAGAEANPYRRGCNALTQCRSWGKTSVNINIFLTACYIYMLVFVFIFPWFFFLDASYYCLLTLNIIDYNVSQCFNGNIVM